MGCLAKYDSPKSNTVDFMGQKGGENECNKIIMKPPWLRLLFRQDELPKWECGRPRSVCTENAPQTVRAAGNPRMLLTNTLALKSGKTQ